MTLLYISPSAWSTCSENTACRWADRKAEAEVLSEAYRNHVFTGKNVSAFSSCKNIYSAWEHCFTRWKVFTLCTLEKQLCKVTPCNFLTAAPEADQRYRTCLFRADRCKTVWQSAALTDFSAAYWWLEGLSRYFDRDKNLARSQVSPMFHHSQVNMNICF